MSTFVKSIYFSEPKLPARSFGTNVKFWHFVKVSNFFAFNVVILTLDIVSDFLTVFQEPNT